jgi:putative phage-type endonuclease
MFRQQTEEERRAWLAARREGIGGSDVAAIMGVSRWKTPLAVYLDKIGHGEEVEDNEPMYWGRALEPIVALEFMRRTCLPLKGIGESLRFKSICYPWMVATLDGLVEDEENPGVLEVKTSRSGAEWGEDGSEDIPQDYVLQGTHYMIVTGRRVCWFPVLIGGSDFRIYRMNYDEELADIITVEEKRFWHEHVLARNPPPATTVEDARAKWPRVSDTGSATAFASDEIVKACVNLSCLKQSQKQIEEQIEREQARIMDAMGGCETLKHGHEILATWKNQKPSMMFDAKAFAVAHPDLHATFLRPKESSRRFLLKSSGKEA